MNKPASLTVYKGYEIAEGTVPDNSGRVSYTVRIPVKGTELRYKTSLKGCQGFIDHLKGKIHEN